LMGIVAAPTEPAASDRERSSRINRNGRFVGRITLLSLLRCSPGASLNLIALSGIDRVDRHNGGYSASRTQTANDDLAVLVAGRDQRTPGRVRTCRQRAASFG
jgi:hypothetical protein